MTNTKIRQLNRGSRAIVLPERFEQFQHFGEEISAMENRFDSAIRPDDFGDDGLDIQPTPPTSGPTLFIKRLKKNEHLEMIVYSRTIFGMNVHFCSRSNRSSAHYSNRDICPGCKGKIPMRWKGWLHGQDLRKRQAIFLELTPASANSLLGQMGDLPDLRGCQLQVKRSDADNGRLYISILKIHPDTLNWPEPIPVLTSLKIMWGVSDKRRNPGFGDNATDGLDG